MWDEESKIQCFLAHMQVPFPNSKILCEHVKFKTGFGVTYEQAKNMQ